MKDEVLKGNETKNKAWRDKKIWEKTEEWRLKEPKLTTKNSAEVGCLKRKKLKEEGSWRRRKCEEKKR